jgi:molybdenum cofactor guanylyltransferase
MRIGIFVGGRSSRMGRPKGLLVTASGETLLQRTLRIAASVGDVVVVGDASEYGVASIADEPPGIGPLGGLHSLLMKGDAIAVACDMPYFEARHLRQLIDAPGEIAAPRREGRWEPLFARYSQSILPTIEARIANRQHSLQPLFANATEVAIEPDALRDWDTPDDTR